MFAAPLQYAEKYHYLEGKFKAAYAFLRCPDLAQLPVGAVSVCEGVTAHVQHYTTFAPETARFETHDTHFDVQYMIEGCEQFGLANRAGLMEDVPYDAINDITFYKEPQYSGSIVLTAGDFVVVAPEDAHKPRCQEKSPIAVKKIVIKIEL